MTLKPWNSYYAQFIVEETEDQTDRLTRLCVHSSGWPGELVSFQSPAPSHSILLQPHARNVLCISSSFITNHWEIEHGTYSFRENVKPPCTLGTLEVFAEARPATRSVLPPAGCLPDRAVRLVLSPHQRQNYQEEGLSSLAFIFILLKSILTPVTAVRPSIEMENTSSGVDL